MARTLQIRLHITDEWTPAIRECIALLDDITVAQHWPEILASTLPREC